MAWSDNNDLFRLNSKLDSGVMCPSYRVTKEEKDLVRGRANTLRLALSNQLPQEKTQLPHYIS